MARAQGSRSQMAMAFESAYGTAPTSGFVKMPFASTSLGAEQPLQESELLGYGRDPLAPVMDAITAGGDVTVPIDVDGIGYWLKGLFGAPITTGTTPKVHTYKSGSFTLPSMSIEVGTPEVPRFAMLKGVMADTLSIQMERSGLLAATIDLVAQGETSATSSAAGTLTPITLQRFGHFNGAIKRNSVSLGNIVSGQIRYSNNLDRVETIRADGMIDGADPSVAAMSGNIVTRFSDTVLLDQAISGAPCSLEFSWTISANASLEITAHAVYLPRPKMPITGPGGIQATFDWQAALAQSPANMCTVVLTNSKTGY